VRFSSRFPWDAPANRLSLAWKARQAAGLPIRDLSISNPNAARLDLSKDLWEGPPRPGELRQAISAYYREEFGEEIAEERIHVCASTSEGYSYCFKLLADAGEEILIPTPSYPLLSHLVGAEALQAVEYVTHFAAGQWILDRECLLRQVNERTRAVVVVTPNNPTGHFWTQEDLDWLDRELPADVAIVTDEVFADYRWAGNLARIPARAFRLSGLSKIYALPQMKIGWIVMPAVQGVAEAMEFVGDTYLSVSGPVAERAAGWLGRRSEFQAPVRERCLENVARLGGGVEAGWVRIVQGPGDRDEESVALEMLERGFWVQPGYFYDLPLRESYVVSLLTPPEDLEAGMEALSSCGR